MDLEDIFEEEVAIRLFNICNQVIGYKDLKDLKKPVPLNRPPLEEFKRLLTIFFLTGTEERYEEMVALLEEEDSEDGIYQVLQSEVYSSSPPPVPVFSLKVFKTVIIYLVCFAWIFDEEYSNLQIIASSIAEAHSCHPNCRAGEIHVCRRGGGFKVDEVVQLVTRKTGLPEDWVFELFGRFSEKIPPH